MDIAARNCLLGDNSLVKLADFGLTRPMDKGTSHYRLKERLAISIKWCAVEALERKCFDEKTDVWSAAVTIWELYTYGELPLKDVPLAQTAAKLKEGARCPKPDGLPAPIWETIESMWIADPAARPNFTTVSSKIQVR